jgi:hypothetical protein
VKKIVLIGTLVLLAIWLLTAKELTLVAKSNVKVFGGVNSLEVVTMLEKGQSAVVLDCEDEKGITWAKVDVNGKVGYVARGNFDVIEKAIWKSKTFHFAYGCSWLPRHLRESDVAARVER